MASQNKSKPIEADELVAVFYQKSTTTTAEMDLVSKTIARDLVIEKLKKIMADINAQRRKQDDESALETLNLMVLLRESTFELVESVVRWQQAFTKNIRPQLCQSDYLVKMIELVEFVGWTVLRKDFNFSLDKNNIFLLPLPNLRTLPPRSCSQEMAKKVFAFAYPNEERVIKNYQYLADCLPARTFRSILPIEKWLVNKWKPRIDIPPPPTESKKLGSVLKSALALKRSFLSSAGKDGNAHAHAGKSNDKGKLKDLVRGKLGAGAGVGVGAGGGKEGKPEAKSDDEDSFSKGSTDNTDNSMASKLASLIAESRESKKKKAFEPELSGENDDAVNQLQQMTRTFVRYKQPPNLLATAEIQNSKELFDEEALSLIKSTQNDITPPPTTSNRPVSVQFKFKNGDNSADAPASAVVAQSFSGDTPLVIDTNVSAAVNTISPLKRGTHAKPTTPKAGGSPAHRMGSPERPSRGTSRGHHGVGTASPERERELEREREREARDSRLGPREVSIEEKAARMGVSTQSIRGAWISDEEARQEKERKRLAKIEMQRQEQLKKDLEAAAAKAAALSLI